MNPAAGATFTAMSDPHYFEALRFGKEIGPEKALQKGVYEGCSFDDADLSGADLTGFRFIDCQFHNMNLSLAVLRKTGFSEVRFSDCKLLGLNFQDCDPFSFQVSFDRCNLDHSTFVRSSLKKTRFIACSLVEADFTEADLQEALFDHCNLQRAIFLHTRLEKADFRTAHGFNIDPSRNRMKKARFSAASLEGLLHVYDLDIE